MRNYYIDYVDNAFEIVSQVVVRAHNLREARGMAQLHKRTTPEIASHRNVRSYVRPAVRRSC